MVPSPQSTVALKVAVESTSWMSARVPEDDSPSVAAKAVPMPARSTVAFYKLGSCCRRRR